MDAFKLSMGSLDIEKIVCLFKLFSELVALQCFDAEGSAAEIKGIGAQRVETVWIDCLSLSKPPAPDLISGLSYFELNELYLFTNDDDISPGFAELCRW